MDNAIMTRVQIMLGWVISFSYKWACLVNDDFLKKLPLLNSHGNLSQIVFKYCRSLTKLYGELA